MKQGYAANPIQDECGTARHANITTAKFSTFFSGVLIKKQELNTLQDTGRKKQQINVKECFWPVTAKSKNVFEVNVSELYPKMKFKQLSIQQE